MKLKESKITDLSNQLYICNCSFECGFFGQVNEDRLILLIIYLSHFYNDLKWMKLKENWNYRIQILSAFKKSWGNYDKIQFPKYFFFYLQVKGVHYSLPYFLGLRVPKGQMLHGAMQNSSDLLMNKDGSTKLYQAVVYLSPGDYHRFHSPVEWTIHTRRYYFFWKYS